jgi:uncharacterized protein (DUF3820 family)
MMPEPLLPTHIHFGEHQGWLLRNVPLEYLTWLLWSEFEEVKLQVTSPLRAPVEAEIERRRQMPPPRDATWRARGWLGRLRLAAQGLSADCGRGIAVASGLQKTEHGLGDGALWLRIIGVSRGTEQCLEDHDLELSSP